MRISAREIFPACHSDGGAVAWFDVIQRRVKQVALLIETSNAYARGLLRGIVGYIREHGAWSLYLAEHGRGDQPPGWLREWRGDGIVARIETAAMAKALRPLRIPVVDVSAARLLRSLPWFETDDAAFAQAAFDHLRERGFRRFAYCGDERFNWSKWRAEHFQRAVESQGGECRHYRPPRRFPRDDVAEIDALGRWLRDIPKPVGLMACYDIRGQQVLDACRREGIEVPDEVAVIGVDNDELLCELSHPPLTSVIPNTYRTGYQAAALLASLMSGEPRRSDSCLVPAHWDRHSPEHRCGGGGGPLTRSSDALQSAIGPAREST